MATDEPFGALTISPALRGGREVVGISVRRDEVKPAFKLHSSSWLHPHRAPASPFHFERLWLLTPLPVHVRDTRMGSASAETDALFMYKQK